MPFMKHEYPKFWPLGKAFGAVGVLDLIDTSVAPQTYLHDWETDRDKGRALVKNKEGEVVSVVFLDAGPAKESVRRKTAHYTDENRPVVADLDITGLQIYPGMLDEGEITLLMNEHGIVPEVSEDLIPY